jgi:Fe-S-cluster-containing hydrogenase component 2
MGLEGRQQYFVLTELCNECGNCMVFCPEVGDPAQVKPRLYTTRERFDVETDQAFLVESANGGYAVIANPAGADHVATLTDLLNAEEGFVLPG